MKPTVLKVVSEPIPLPTDIQTMRERERQHIEEGVVTSGYGADRETVIRLLNEALATEIACVLRYKRHYFKAATAKAAPAAAASREAANESIAHASLVAECVGALPGEPTSIPVDPATRTHAEYVEDVTRSAMNKLRELIKEDLLTGRPITESYRETFSFRVAGDPTARLLDEILADEEGVPTTIPSTSRDV